MNNRLKELTDIILSFDVNLKKLEEDHRKKENEFYQEYWKNRDELQKICPHDKVKYESCYNYHNGTDDGHWECVLCKKYVKPKTTIKYE